MCSASSYDRSSRFTTGRRSSFSCSFKKEEEKAKRKENKTNKQQQLQQLKNSYFNREKIIGGENKRRSLQWRRQWSGNCHFSPAARISLPDFSAVWLSMNTDRTMREEARGQMFRQYTLRFQPGNRPGRDPLVLLLRPILVRLIVLFLSLFFFFRSKDAQFLGIYSQYSYVRA